MAIYNGSRSLERGCDVFYDHACGPCLVGGTRRESKHHCTECQDYLCDSCKGYHRNLAVTRNHKMVSGSKISASASASSGLGIACGCNRNRLIEIYCETHKDVVCNPCKVFIIKNVKLLVSNRKALIINHLRWIKFCLKYSHWNIHTMDLSKNTAVMIRKWNGWRKLVKKRSKPFVNNLMRFLIIWRKNMLTELDRWEIAESRRIDQDISDLTTAMKVVESDCTLLEDAKKDGRNDMMFTADVLVSKVIQGYESKLGELEKCAEKPSLAFERNKALDNLITEVKSLGFLKTQHKGSNRDDRPLKTVISGRKLLLGRNVLSCSQACGKTDVGKKSPWMYGYAKWSCCAMWLQNGHVVICDYNNGHVVLCDYNNNKIKLLDRSTSIVGS